MKRSIAQTKVELLQELRLLTKAYGARPRSDETANRKEINLRRAGVANHDTKLQHLFASWIEWQEQSGRAYASCEIAKKGTLTRPAKRDKTGESNMKRLMIALLLMVPLQGYAQSAAQVWAARQCDGYFARGTPEHNQCMMQSLAAGMQGGGPLVSPDVYNAPAPGALPPPPSAPRDRQMDFACLQNCTRYNYSLQYCQTRCSY